MGDFYELFFEDAEIASGALGIALTTRGSHLGVAIPMCGVPVRAHQEYLRKLISFGHRVAICEQMEDPAEAKKRGNKSVVKRDVVRLVTPGTITEDNLLPAQTNNFLGALSIVRHGETDFALAWADISTGESYVVDLTLDQLFDELGRLDLAELILTQKTWDQIGDQIHVLQNLVSHISVQELQSLETGSQPDNVAHDVLKEAFPELSASSFTHASRAALTALVAYVAKTQKAAGIALRPPEVNKLNQNMHIDLATWSSLEILRTNGGDIKGSLRHAIDRTITAAGSRLLCRRLTAPLADDKLINDRLDMVEALEGNTALSQNLHQALKGMPDLTRPLTRLSLGRGGPRDLVHIALALQSAQNVLHLLKEDEEKPSDVTLPLGFSEIMKALEDAPQALAKDILATLIDQPPLLARDGEFVRQNCHEELDRQRTLARKSRTIISEMQAQLALEVDIKPLKIKHNKVLGFFIEVPVAYGKKLLEAPFIQKFIHRQTMANAMRFTTTHLNELEGEISRAQHMAVEFEVALFDAFRNAVLEKIPALRLTSDALANIDVTLSMANLAADASYCRPKVDRSLSFKITGGRHPVVEQTLAAQGQDFVTNDCNLSDVLHPVKKGKKKTKDKSSGGQLWLVTGPNMGGKSTFLRQNALIAILAQIGSFVPAKSAHIGIVDRLFSRVGASDDIARGRSTFMVEMVETAAILNRATKHSLVILDEIGRGTATFDGLSIAWATAEALHQTNASRALFATHFHEMTSLSDKLERVSNHTMKAREFEGEVVFLHEVTEGAADRSYGIQVAALAGLPEAVLIRAREILTILENENSSKPGKLLDNLSQFVAHAPQKVARDNPVFDMIDNLHPDELTPRQAIEFIYDLKKMRTESSSKPNRRN